MQPNVTQTNLFAGLTVKLNEDWQLYGEAGFAARRTDFTMIPASITPTVVFPGGITNYGSGVGTDLKMAATHPQNPYGAAVRIRYSAFDIGPSVRNADNDYNRIVIGARGSAMGWDLDTAYVHSATQLDLAYTNMLNMPVLVAALSDPKSQYFPYYVGAQASKNPASLYAALVRTATSHSTTSLDLADFKASRELPWSLPGGAVALAVGAEYRKDQIDNPSLSGSENGSVNSNYVAAFGDQTVYAVYAEAVAPVFKELEVNLAVRHDKYDNFSSTTPKLGLKYTPLRNFALRGTYAEGFRAPGAAESGARSQSTGTASARDPIRCPGGTPAVGAQASDCATPIAGVKVGDPNLRPETSRGVTLGTVWDITPNTSMALDVWRIKRSDEINPMPYNEVAARPDAIRSDNNLIVNGKVVPNSGTLIVAFAPYRNSSYTQVKGVDFDFSHRLTLGEYGKLRGDLKVTHLISWLRAESATVQYQYAGTHGNCDTSNCAGTPKDKATLALSWDLGPWQVATTTGYRSAMEMRAFKGDICAFSYADGTPAPKGCRLASFTTTDLSVKYQFSKQLQLFGSVANLFDKIAPLDPLTYGGLSYNPMDASGAIGRYMKIGARYQF
jgi:iron complex outermembrane receptor protein